MQKIGFHWLWFLDLYSLRYHIRKILFDWSLQNILLFCIKVGFILPVCCYVKLIKQLFVSLLLLFGLNFILIHAKKAITVKDFQSKVKAVTISLLYCWFNHYFRTTTLLVQLLTSCICMKQWFSVMSLYISCFNICRLLFNKLRIGVVKSTYQLYQPLFYQSEGSLLVMWSIFLRSRLVK